MVTQNMVRTHQGKKGFLKKKSYFLYIMMFIPNISLTRQVGDKKQQKFHKKEFTLKGSVR